MFELPHPSRIGVVESIRSVTPISPGVFGADDAAARKSSIFFVM